MKVTYTGESPYGLLICNYFNAQFPRLAKVDERNMLELLTGIIVGTKDLRFGTLPSPEVLVNVRKVIAHAIDKGERIPALVPWGGRKAWAGSRLDIAEVSAVRQLVRVDQAVRELYPPGMHYALRVEDTNAEWLYQGQDNLHAEVTEYTAAMLKLVKILRDTTTIDVFPESLMMDRAAYFAEAKALVPELEDFIAYTDAMGFDAPKARERTHQFHNITGWKGIIPMEQRDYYRARYFNQYPGIDKATATHMLAMYFAGSKARYNLRGLGDQAFDTPHMQINFAHPVPGTPINMFTNTLHYRTIPMSAARTHIPAWRGKGYLKINGNDITPKITHWGDRDTLSQLESATHRIENGIEAVTIQTDYLIES